MSYEPNTLLVRDEPKGDRFDKIRVIGQSPVTSGAAVAEWGGNAQSNVLIVQPLGEETETVTYADEDGNPETREQPVTFFATEIIPDEALNRHFSVEYEPDPAPTHVETEQRRRHVRLVAPEEQFRIAHKNDYDREKTEKAIERQRTPIGKRK
jgi:hypothetical protein